MCDTSFTIAQRGGFHFECPSQWKFGRLPERAQALFSEDKIASVYNLVLGQDNVYFCAYKGKDGQDHISSAGLPERLRDFLFEKDSKGESIRSFPDLRVSLGPYNNSFFVTDGKKTRWLGLPTGLSESLNENRDSSGSWTDTPRLVVLGAHENYLMITEGNSAAWSLGGYRELQAYFQAFKDGETSLSIIHVSSNERASASLVARTSETLVELTEPKNVFLNPYRLNNWILQGTNGTVFGGGMPVFAQKPFDDIKASIKTDTEAKLQRELEAQKREVEARRVNRQVANAQASQLVATNKLMQQIKLNQQLNQMLMTQAAMNNMAQMNSFSNPFDMSAFWQPIADAANF